MRRTDGSYEHVKHEARLVFPKGVWEGPAGTKFRFTIDLHMIQPGGGQGRTPGKIRFERVEIEKLV